MQMRLLASAVLIFIWIGALSCAGISAQQAPKSAAAQAGATPGSGNQQAPRAMVEGNLLQVMRSILFVNSNVIFYAQAHDPTAVQRDKDPTQSTDPLKGDYAGWEAIENSSIALAEAANLLTIPGRVCSNGKPAPIQNADWIKAVQQLRDASMASYKAAKSKSQDAIVDVSDTLTTACASCHDVYREKTPKQGGMAARCTK
jgi:hypothetical protein